jgi:hypothetical protein
LETNASTPPLDGSIADQRAAALAECRFAISCSLMSSVRRDVVAGLRAGARERADAAPGGVDLDLLEAGGAVQLLLVARLQPRLADVIGAAVVGLDLELDELFLVFALMRRCSR